MYSAFFLSSFFWACLFLNSKLPLLRFSFFHWLKILSVQILVFSEHVVWNVHLFSSTLLFYKECCGCCWRVRNVRFLIKYLKYI